MVYGLYFSGEITDPVAERHKTLLTGLAALAVLFGFINTWATLMWKSRPLLALALNSSTTGIFFIAARFIENLANA